MSVKKEYYIEWVSHQDNSIVRDTADEFCDLAEANPSELKYQKIFKREGYNIIVSD